MNFRDPYLGLMLGTAVGDSLGLPAEGLSRTRAQKLFPGKWKHRLIGNRGMCSDDTEHTFFVIQSLLSDSHSADGFAKRLAFQLRWWFATLPAGIGLATAKACIKLWLGFSPNKSGIFSAGNGPAMRVAAIGAFFHDKPEKRNQFVTASTLLTHTDPKALTGALTIAHTAAWLMGQDAGCRPELTAFMDVVRQVDGDDDWKLVVEQIEQTLKNDLSVMEFAAVIDCQHGVSGYIYDTVPVVLFSLFKHWGDFESALESILNCGGDTDTTGAIIGALAGILVGKKGIPADWIDGIADYPRSTAVMEHATLGLAELKAGNTEMGKPVSYFWPLLPIRNVIFLLVVLLHGFRRLLPPY